MEELVAFVNGKVEKYNNCSARHTDIGLIELPIAEINELPVNVYICIYKITELSLQLIIRSSRVWDTAEDDFMIVYTEKDIPISEGIGNICQKYVDTINVLKVDKLNSQLTTEKPSILCKSLFNNNVKLRFESCSVCLDDTNRKTHCGHYLCLLCVSKITAECSECNRGIKCPICRETINICDC
jgi:hypothetical protein